MLSATAVAEEDDDVSVPNEDEFLERKKSKIISKDQERHPPPPQIKNQLSESSATEQLEKKGKEFLKRKTKDIGFQKLNWKNVKSRTDTGRQELQQRAVYEQQ